MELYLNKRIVNAVFILILIGGYFVVYLNYSEIRNAVNREYARYKEISFLIKNFGNQRRREVDEVFLNQFFRNAGVEVKSISSVEDIFIVNIKSVNIFKLADIIYRLEREGLEIKLMRAVDNTGEGVYEVELKIK